MNIKGGLDCRVTGALGNIYHYINYQHPSSSDYFWHAIMYFLTKIWHQENNEWNETLQSWSNSLVTLDD